MINGYPILVSALQQVLPTHYEMALTSSKKTPLPCISYMELNNYVHANGDTLGYGYLRYQVKVWGHDIVELQNYVLEIDKVLRPLGFKRVATGELYDNTSTMIQKILTYEAMALEEF